MAAETQSIRAASQAATWVGELRLLGDAQVIGSLKKNAPLPSWRRGTARLRPIIAHLLGHWAAAGIDAAAIDADEPGDRPRPDAVGRGGAAARGPPGGGCSGCS
jgi:hypothetical protein